MLCSLNNPFPWTKEDMLAIQLNILIVETDENMRNLFSRALASYEFEFQVVESIALAVQEINDSEKDYDVLIICHDPEHSLDAHELLNKKFAHSIPSYIILITSEELDISDLQNSAFNPDFVIFKPIVMSTIIDFLFTVR